jgi:phosphatidylglycerophosphate synthase
MNSRVTGKATQRHFIDISGELIASLPTWLTSTRVILTSIMLTTLVEGGQGFPIYVVACLTDVLDGALARWLHVESKLGGWLDAASDFLLVFSTSVFLFWAGLAPFWFLCLLIVSFMKYVFRDASRPDPLGKHIGTIIFLALGVILLFPVNYIAIWSTNVASFYIVTSMILSHILPRRT